MKAILQFSIPEEQEEFKYAQAGAELAIVLRDVLENIRRREKLSQDQIRDIILEHLEARDLSWVLG